MIRMMTSADNKDLPNVETVTDYHGHEVTRIAHAYKCPNDHKPEFTHQLGPGCAPHNPEQKQFGCHNFGPLYMMTTYVGRVLRTWERNGYDDSDFYATVWNDETGQPEEIQYASTRGWTYPNGANVDADEETRGKYEAWRREQIQRARQLAAEEQARKPERGKQVRVVRGRKYYGQTGRIFWQGVNQFRTYYRTGYNKPTDLHNQRFGIETATGARFFVQGDYVEVILDSETAVAA
jgi:hypothetical protein